MALATETDVNGVSRVQFFKSMGGAALAVSGLSSTNVFVSEAHAAQRDARVAAQAKEMREEAAKISRAVSVVEEHMRIGKDGTLGLDPDQAYRHVGYGSDVSWWLAVARLVSRVVPFGVKTGELSISM